MAESKHELSEREVNRLIAGKMRSFGLLVLQELRLHPCEMDIVILDRETHRLAAIEIKQRRWRALLAQATRAKLYCHFALAAMPASVGRNVPVEEFAREGIGLIFYEASHRRIRLRLANKPSLSASINRGLKRQVYRKFHDQYGDTLHA